MLFFEDFMYLTEFQHLMKYWYVWGTIFVILISLMALMNRKGKK